MSLGLDREPDPIRCHRLPPLDLAVAQQMDARDLVLEELPGHVHGHLVGDAQALLAPSASLRRRSGTTRRSRPNGRGRRTAAPASSNREAPPATPPAPGNARI